MTPDDLKPEHKRIDLEEIDLYLHGSYAWSVQT